MRKNLPAGQEPKMRLENHSPGCTWGSIFNQFHHNRWLNAKKKLPYKRRTAPGKDSSADQDSNKTNSEAAEIQEKMDPVVEDSAVETAKSKESSPAHKNNSMKSIKALISKEMSKRKGRHRRSSSCPIRTTTRVSTNPIEPNSDVDSPSENTPNSEASSFHNNVQNATPEHVRNSSCEWCAAMLNVHYLTQSEVNSLGQHPVRDHTLLQDKCIYAIEPGKYASHQESKLFMDALDLLNMRKEVFLKILQDPNSSLANQLRSRRGPHNVRLGLKKSSSFPVSSSSARRSLGIKPDEESQPFMTEEFNKHLKDSSSTENLPTPQQLELSEKKRNDSKLALKHFKNLKDKIKHVIRDRKKEKNRIIMDAVHHKIPYGQILNDDSASSHSITAPEDKTVCKYNHGFDSGLSPFHRMKRTSSFNESLDRYNRLLEISLRREEEEEAKDNNNNNSEKLRFRASDTSSPVGKTPANDIVRILSLPDLRAYSSIQNDDSPSHSSTHNTDMTEQKPTLPRVISENKVVSDSESRENLLDVGETFEDSADSRTWETASSHDFSDLEPVRSSDRPPLKSDQVSENCEGNYQEEDAGQELEVSVSEDSKFEDPSASQQDLTDLDDPNNSISDDTIPIPMDSSLETQVKQIYDALMHVQVDTKNKAQFNYVKDVLELSGFSKDEMLGKWHSAESPLDPLVFEEIEGCSGESGGVYDHLLLFDLINEVLLDIYDRSFSYWPRPQTTRCRVHKMPKGHHVLEEVWTEISWFLSWMPEMDQAIDDSVSRDLAKNSGWMNLQLDAETVGLELEDLIFDELLDEIIYS